MKLARKIRANIHPYENMAKSKKITEVREKKMDQLA